MITVTPKQLAKAYSELYPEELISANNSPEECLIQIEEAVGNWLFRYEHLSDTCISNSNWSGKVTKALFVALRIKKPNTVKAMLESLK